MEGLFFLAAQIMIVAVTISALVHDRRKPIEPESDQGAGAEDKKDVSKMRGKKRVGAVGGGGPVQRYGGNLP